MSSRAERVRPGDFAAPVVVATTLVVTASASGAYFPREWGSSAVALGLIAVAVLVRVERFELTRLELMAIGGLGGYAAWAGLSAAWSASVPRSISELQRDLVYVAGAAAILLLTRRRSAELLAVSALAGAAAATLWGLTMQLFPDRFGFDFSSMNFRLGRPLGYSGALAIVAAMALLLALGVAASSFRLRSAAAALVPLLVTAIYLTLSRSAWLALAVGIVMLVVLSPERLRTGVVVASLTVPAGVALWLAAHSPGLSEANPQLATATRSGHRLFVALLLLAVVSAALPATASRLVSRWAPQLRMRTRKLGAIGLVAGAAGVAALVVFAGPLYDALRSPPPPTGSSGTRLLSASTSGRLDYWRIAWHDVEQHPLLGSGAGTYELRWDRERPNPYNVRDAHTLYVEALAEVGPVGLGLLLVGFVPALAAARRARTTVTAAAAAAYCTYLVHAGVDWDWETPTVTLTAIACACVLLAHARPERAPSRIGPLVRTGAVAAGGVVVTIAFIGYLGAAALQQSDGALGAGDLTAARAYARRAAHLEPWSPAPWRVLGDIDGRTGDLDAARANYSRMLAKDPNDWFGWYAVGLASRGSARLTAAHEGLRLNPKSPELASLLER